MAYRKSWDRIASKLQKLLKARIKQLGLIDTGLLYDSISVYPDGDSSFIVKAEDYFKYLDGDYNIISYCVNSKEFLDYVEQSIKEDINIELEEF